MLLVVATLLLASCGKPEDKFVGQYDGEPDSAAAGKSDSAVAGKWVGHTRITDEDLAKLGVETEEDKQAARDLFDSLGYRLELREDSTYTLTFAGGSFDDTWKWENGDIVLASSGSSYRSSTDTETGKTTESTTLNKEPMTLQVSSDGTELIVEMSGEGEVAAALVFSRDTAD